MIQRIKEFIPKIYRWFWDELMCRKEPYTYQLTRQMVHHGIIFWIGFYIIAGFLFYHFFYSAFWWKMLSGAGLIVLAWLTDHLIDQVRLNPEKYND